MQLPTPAAIKSELPLTSPEIIASFRQEAIDILQRKTPRLALLVGPCSVHESKSALEYAEKLKKLSCEIAPLFFPIMRLFFEKPRTRVGWKGMLYDPHLDGSHDIAAGIRKTRSLLLQVTALGVPCAAELLEPLALPYFDDLIVWGLIGARTSASQPHRQLASGLHFPVGFKNDCQGGFEEAISGILSSRTPHARLGIDASGHIASLPTNGNPWTHLVLRGSEKAPNYDASSIARAIQALREEHLEERLLIDCSHGNCGKNHMKQAQVFRHCVEQALHNPSIMGLMLESHLFAGKQPFCAEESHALRYGVSITDPCLGWEETEALLRSISFVQN